MLGSCFGGMGLPLLFPKAWVVSSGNYEQWVSVCYFVAFKGFGDIAILPGIV